MEISVIIPVYNTGTILSETVASVLNQSFSDFELLLIDDGSDAATQQVLAGFNDPRIRVIRQENRGMAGARNRGLAEARGKYAAFCDHDDLWHPEKLAIQKAVLDREPAVVMVYSPVEVFGENSGAALNLPPVNGRCMIEMVRRNVICSLSCVMMRREVLTKYRISFDPECVPCDDWALYLELLRHGEIRCTEMTLVRYRMHGGSQSNQRMKMYEAGLRVLTKFLPTLPDVSAETGIPQWKLTASWRRGKAGYCYGIAWQRAMTSRESREFFPAWKAALKANVCSLRTWLLPLRWLVKR